MIKVLLMSREISGDWDTAVVQSHVRQGGVVFTLDLKGKDGDASFNMEQVIGWYVVKEEETKESNDVSESKLPKPTTPAAKGAASTL